MVPLKAPGERTTALNDSFPCVFNGSQMCCSPRLSSSGCCGKEKKGHDESGFWSWSCTTSLVPPVVLGQRRMSCEGALPRIL